MVIAAGHGGIDAGAIGCADIEKDVNLRTAKQLAEAFSRNRNIRVILTRDHNEFLTLSDGPRSPTGQSDLLFPFTPTPRCRSKAPAFETYIFHPRRPTSGRGRGSY